MEDGVRSKGPGYVLCINHYYVVLQVSCKARYARRHVAADTLVLRRREGEERKKKLGGENGTRFQGAP